MYIGLLLSAVKQSPNSVFNTESIRLIISDGMVCSLGNKLFANLHEYCLINPMGLIDSSRYKLVIGLIVDSTP